VASYGEDAAEAFGGSAARRFWRLRERSLMQESIGQGAMKNTSVRTAVVVTATILAVLTALLIGGILTPRSFGIAGLAAMVVCGSVWYFVVKSFSQIDGGKRLSESQHENEWQRTLPSSCWTPDFPGFCRVGY
jgi:hypothetical protein